LISRRHAAAAAALSAIALVVGCGGGDQATERSSTPQVQVVPPGPRVVTDRAEIRRIVDEAIARKAAEKASGKHRPVTPAQIVQEILDGRSGRNQQAPERGDVKRALPVPLDKGR
jgi:hypothetical protein